MAMTDDEPTLLPGIRRALPGLVAPHEVTQAVRAGHVLAGTGGVLATSRGVSRHLFGAGALDGPLSLPGVSDVVVNGPGVVWVDCGAGLQDSGVRVDSERELRALAHRLV